MKTVYSNDEIAHVWAHNGQHAARNSGDSMSFNGDNFYSYNTIIARRVNETVIISTRHYSSTTARHMSYVRRVAGYNAVSCFDVNDDVTTNYKTMTNQVLALVKKQETARKIDYISQARDVISTFKEYADVMEYKMPADTVEGIASIDAAALKKAAALRLKQERARKKEAAAFQRGINWDTVERAYNVARDAFHAGHLMPYNSIMRKLGDFNHQLRGHNIAAPKRYYSDFLRITAGGVITSQGVNIKTEEARGLFLALKSGADIVGQRISHYTINEITPEFLRAGCHTIPRAEISYVSKKLFGEVV